MAGPEIRLTPATVPYELLRQTAGLEVHEQGQGPGFASDASLRGFSSDHSTDIALWVDGVPVNEPVNGHAEGYNDWSRAVSRRHPGHRRHSRADERAVRQLRARRRRERSHARANARHRGHGGRRIVRPRRRDAHDRLRSRAARRRRARRALSARGRLSAERAATTSARATRASCTIFGPADARRAALELYGGNWDSPGFSERGRVRGARLRRRLEPDATADYKRRAQERVSLRVLTGNTHLAHDGVRDAGPLAALPHDSAGGRTVRGIGQSDAKKKTRAPGSARRARSPGRCRTARLTVGGETRWDRSQLSELLHDAPRARDSVAALVTGRQLLGAPFAQSHFNLTDRLRFDLGARYDALGDAIDPRRRAPPSATHGVFSPKFGALFSVTPTIGVYANVSRGFRSTRRRDHRSVARRRSPNGLRDRRQVRSRRRDASAALFRADVSNEQTFNPVTLESSNGGASRRQGVELDVAHSRDRAVSVDRRMDVQRRALSKSRRRSGGGRRTDGAQRPPHLQHVEICRRRRDSTSDRAGRPLARSHLPATGSGRTHRSTGLAMCCPGMAWRT